MITKPIIKAIALSIITTAAIFLISFVALVPLGEVGMIWIICMVPISLICGGVVTGFKTKMKENIKTGMYALLASGPYCSVLLWTPPFNKAFVDSSGRMLVTLLFTLLSIAGVYLGNFLATRKKRNANKEEAPT